MITRRSSGHIAQVPLVASNAIPLALAATTVTASRAPATHHPRLDGLVRDHYPSVWRTLRRLGVPDADVDDRAQQVFVIFARKVDQVEVGRERAFLLGVAIRVGSDARRAGRRRASHEAPWPTVVGPRHGGETDGHTPREYPSTLPPPDECTEQREARAMLDRLLDALPSELRTVLVLFEIEELETSEIAAALELPMGTVASRLRRAREQFESEVQRMRAQARSRSATAGAP